MATESRLDEPAAAQSPPASTDEPALSQLPVRVDVRSVSLTILAAAAVLAILDLAQSVIIPFVVSGLLFGALALALLAFAAAVVDPYHPFKTMRLRRNQSVSGVQ